MSRLIAEAIVEAVLRPVLDEIHRETGQLVQVSVLLLGESEQPMSIDVGSVASHGAQIPAKGQVRVRIKPPSDTNLVRFEAEAIINGISPGSGYSGFALQGKLDVSVRPPIALISARTNRYNVWNWGRKFRGPDE